MKAAQEAAGELGIAGSVEIPTAFTTSPQRVDRVGNSAAAAAVAAAAAAAAFAAAPPSAPREQPEEMFRAPTTVVQLPGLGVPQPEPHVERQVPVILTGGERMPESAVARPSIVVDDAEQWIAQHMVSTGTRITKKDSDTLKSHPQYTRKVLYRCSRYKVKDRRCQNGAGISLPSRRQMNRWLQLCELANARTDGEALIESSLLVLAEKIQSPTNQS